ncbi:hypothetical protein A2I99_01340 [Acholeplasma laidlawii]|nr:hypothetical protein A2I99_01340 [Acholeplasma laidlawii]
MSYLIVKREVILSVKYHQFCHIILKKHLLKSDEDIYKYLLIGKVMSPIYVISDDEKIDGQFVHPEKALNHTLFGGGTYILLFNHAIFIKEEIGYGSPKYIIFVDK